MHPVPRLSVLPVTLSGATGTPRRNSMVKWLFPSRRNSKAQPFGDALTTDTPTRAGHRDLVGIVVELPAAWSSVITIFRSRALAFVVFVELGGNAAAVINYANRVVV